MLHVVALVIAALCAGTMGFAIQRGATCTVVAVEEVVRRRSAWRLLAMTEASLWVTGGLLIAYRAGWIAHLPSGHELNALTLVGAVLLGLGAFTAGACVFGAVARIGSGDWVFAATPLGFYIGCLGATLIFHVKPALVRNGGPAILAAQTEMVWLFMGLVAWRVIAPVLHHRRRLRTLFGRRPWSPHAATIVIGIAFLVLLILAGPWAYTDVLADLARGMVGDVTTRVLLLICLFAGAMVGGRTSGQPRPRPVQLVRLARCLIGGTLMGLGSLLIPGGNDGLILVGMPMLWPDAWAAFLTMCLSIAAAQVMHHRLRWRRDVQGSS